MELISVKFKSDGKAVFVLNEQAIEIIKSIETEIAVVGFCGKQGVGKSTLLNIILRKQKEFGVSYLV
jgi:putative ribosome biogenesis GTPase RsgA